MEIRVFRGSGGNASSAIRLGTRRAVRRAAAVAIAVGLLALAVIASAALVALTQSSVAVTDQEQIPIPMVDAPGTLPGDDYIETCRANDVPIPPDWPDDRWVSKGELPFVFAEFPDAKTNEVYTFEDPNGRGVCYALVRKNHNRFFEAVGIICQSKRTGKACFWDNVIPGERRDDRIRGLEIKLDMRKIGNGFNMRQNCTECHRGAKVFLIHPDTALSAIVATKPDVRYSPIGQKDWDNPPPMEHRGSGACSQCHELATPTKRYCGMLRQAAEKTMPSRDRPAGWENPLPEFKEAIDRIKARCARFGE